MKRLAICLYGHCRTFELTYQNFFKFVVDENKLDGYEVDIFFHTWDVYHDSFGSWHKYNAFLDSVRLSNNIKNKLFDNYKPVNYTIDIWENGEIGADISLDRVNKLREEYEKNNGKYEYVIYTRMDIMFLYPFKINKYIRAYNHRELIKIQPKEEKIMFVCNNAFVRFPILDSKYPNEGDLLWFSNFSTKRPHIENSFRVVFVDYRVNNHFFIARSNLLMEENVWKRIDRFEEFIEAQSFQTKYGTAKTRIQNQLSYKLGQAMIANSKSFLGYIRMPFVLFYIKDKHNQEQKIYQEKIKKDPSLKLPPLEDYPDYQEALKLKNHLSYKLGQALIQANKTWYGGGVYQTAI
ncbi:hypothetical protein L8Z05_02655 [Campylobacter lari]|nr:hypothetical protein [Campylobacter lari]